MHKERAQEAEAAFAEARAERDEARRAAEDDDMWKVAANEWATQRRALVAELDSLLALKTAARAWRADGGGGQSRDLWGPTEAEYSLEAAVDALPEEP
jgi:hypothetical protein